MKTRRYKFKRGLAEIWVTEQGVTKRQVKAKRDRDNRETINALVNAGAFGAAWLVSEWRRVGGIHRPGDVYPSQ